MRFGSARNRNTASHLRVLSDFWDLSLTIVEFGFGADANIAARVYFTKALSGQVGYWMWWNRIIDHT